MPKPNLYDVIIVGSGVAGMAAADLLCNHGQRVLVVDDNATAGGQLLRRPPNASGGEGRFEPDRLKVWSTHLATSLNQGRAHLLQNAQVLGIFSENTLLVEEDREQVAEYRTDALILATGARERHLPFKGWTLPGVISTGAAQILMKSSGILPGENTLIAGCTPLMLALAAEILANRGGVLAVLDESTITAKLHMMRAGMAVWPKLLEGAIYLARLTAARVPLRQDLRVIEARGEKSLETVVAARIGPNGRVIQGSEGFYPTDTLAVGHGFTPNIELPLQAGCRVDHAVGKGGWYVEVKDTMETSLANIYAIGETTGIAGGVKSYIEGRLAAWDILIKQERVNPCTYAAQTRQLIRRRNSQVRYGRFLNTLCRPSAGAYTEIPDEALICRCEGVTMGAIRKHLAGGVTTMNGLKKASRGGMGICQGRTCAPILFDILSAYGSRANTHRYSAQRLGFTSARAPVKAVSLGALAQMKRLSDGDTNDGDEVQAIRRKTL